MTGSLTMSGPKISLRRRLAIRRILICRRAPGHSRHDRDLVLLRHLRIEAGAQTNVLVVQVDVHELPEPPALVQQAILEAWVARVERIDRRPEIRGFDGDCDLALGEAPKRSWDAKLRHG